LAAYASTTRLIIYRDGHRRCGIGAFFNVTITPEGQTFWLDTPDHVASLE
jgi:hypothetical protein